MHMFYGPGGGWGWGWGGMIISMLLWLLVIGGIIYFIYWLIRRQNTPGDLEQHYSAMDVLKKRYAAGEINREEFLSMKEELKNE
ncbi:SHOCT domain-containing protein [Desulfoscipio geothermicus]|uniref:Putative membrane protein n=1 Tax=Desulfoscipio geothermicus DSM 3669 TaxID=1121426 RepID=A0A1I6CRV3_9FIRM|nr:SHOCT domain-containing protein [Desulfoscipio geothermicus]SFQ95918.1 putative membrane protein [Desulfoscipio geothermicus DSM 3669]